MGKRHYQKWVTEEEADLKDFYARHFGKTWKEMAVEYLHEYGINRTDQSLRSKKRQLDKNIRRRRPVRSRPSREHKKMAQQLQHQQQRAASGSAPIRIPTPPVLTPKARSPRMQMVLQQKLKPTSWSLSQYNPTNRLSEAGVPSSGPPVVAQHKRAERKPLDFDSFKELDRDKSSKNYQDPDRLRRPPPQFREPTQRRAPLWRLIDRVVGRSWQ